MRKLNCKLKFTMDQVRLLRQVYSDKDKPAYMSQQFLARLHNVHDLTMHRILNEITYREL